VAHYSVIVAVESGRLVARATRDFLIPVPAAALVIAPGDEVLWFCDSGELRLLFEESPFQTGILEIEVSRGKPTPPETVVGLASRQREVFRYAVRFDNGSDRPAKGVAYVIVEAPAIARAESQGAKQAKSGARLGRPEEFVLDMREGEFLDRSGGEGSTVKHKLKVKKSGNKVDYDYEKGGSSTPVSEAVPYLIVKKFDLVEFEAPVDGVVIVAFRGDESPFADGVSLLLLRPGEKDSKTIRDLVAKKTIGYKYTTVLLQDLDTKIYVDDPQIIVDNSG